MRTTLEPSQNLKALVIKGGQGRRQGRKTPRATTLEPIQNPTEPIGTERPAAQISQGQDSQNRLARAKAHRGFRRNMGGQLVLIPRRSQDTVTVEDGRVLEYPIEKWSAFGFRLSVFGLRHFDCLRCRSEGLMPRRGRHLPANAFKLGQTTSFFFSASTMKRE